MLYASLRPELLPDYRVLFLQYQRFYLTNTTVEHLRRNTFRSPLGLPVKRAMDDGILQDARPRLRVTHRRFVVSKLRRPIFMMNPVTLSFSVKADSG
jgi:hypothetical protein